MLGVLMFVYLAWYLMNWCSYHSVFLFVFRELSVSIGIMRWRGLTQGIAGTGYPGVAFIQLVLLDTLWVLIYLEPCICTLPLLFNFLHAWSGMPETTTFFSTYCTLVGWAFVIKYNWSFWVKPIMHYEKFLSEHSLNPSPLGTTQQLK